MSSSSIQWETPELPVELPKNQIHVWRANLPMRSANQLLPSSFLSEDEMARALRFHFDRDRIRFIVARGTLRMVLASYLNISPVDVRFRYEEYGKPTLDFGLQVDVLNFNLSHSGDVALFAVGWERKIGIDIERIQEDFGGMDVASRYFSISELKSLLSLPSELRPLGFFNGWTRKEAYVKARGDGLQLRLDSFDVTLAPETRPQFLRGVSEDWQLVSVFVKPSFAAALVYNGFPCEIRFLEASPPIA